MHSVVSTFPVPAFSLCSFFQVPGELDSEVETSPDFLFLILSFFSRLDVSCAPNGVCCTGLRAAADLWVRVLSPAQYFKINCREELGRHRVILGCYCLLSYTVWNVSA